MSFELYLRIYGNCSIGREWKTTVEKSENRLYYISGGSGGYVKDGKRIPFEIGRFYFLPAYAEIETYTDDHVEHSFLNFELIPPVISKDALSPEISDGILSNVADLFVELCKKASNGLSLSEQELLRACAIHLCANAAEVSGAEVLEDETVNKALQMIHEDLSVSVRRLAEACYMSEDGLIRRFKRYMGKTPYEYIKLLRIRTAEQYKRAGATLSQIAEICGYSDASSLSHALKKK